MTIQQLKCFVVMSEVLHYTKAAEKLHVSQPSLSYSISELEKELGLSLFKRIDNKTAITRYGKEILPSAKAVLYHEESIRVRCYELTDQSAGVINLGNIYSLSFDFVPMLLERFYAYPENVQVSLNFFQGINKTLANMLMDGSLDLVISGWPQNGEIEGECITVQELKLLVPLSHRLAGRDEVTLEDIKDEPLISVGENANHIAECAKKRGFAANFVLEVAECSAVGAFVSSGMGVAILPIIPSYSNNNVRIVPFAAADRALLDRKIFLLWRKERHLPPVVRRFRQFVLRDLRNREVSSDPIAAMQTL